MRVLILRTPGLDLIHELKGKGIQLPTDCLEGEVKDLNEKAAEALIELHLAERVEKPSGGYDPPAKRESADKK